MFPQVNSVRQTGSVKGYPYFATGLYRIAYTLAGRMVWRLVATGDSRRSDRIEFLGKVDPAAPALRGIRHNKPVTAVELSVIRKLAAGAA